MSELKIESAAELAARVELMRQRIRSGLQRVGEWQIDPNNNTIRHRPSHFYIDLGRVKTREAAFDQIELAAQQQESWMPSQDVGDLVRMFAWLGLVR